MLKRLFPLFCGILCLLLLRSFDDLDLFTQIRLGFHQLAARSLIQSDPLTILRENSLIPNPGWLYQILAACLVITGGLTALLIASAAIFVLAFVILTHPSHDASSERPTAAIVLAVTLAFLIAVPWSFMRPQIFAMLGFVLTLRFLQLKSLSLKSVVWFIPAVLLWVNIHPSTSLGIILCFIALFHGSFLVPFFAAVVLGLAQLATPDSFQLFDVTEKNFEISRNLLAVSEWLPAWNFPIISGFLPFWFSVLLTLILFYRHRGEYSRSEVLGFVAFTGLSVYAARFSLFYALFMCTIWARLISKEWVVKRWENLLSPKVVRSISMLLGACLLVLTIRPFQNPHSELESVISSLNEEVSHQRIYNFLPWGGPIEYWSSPGTRVAIDGRLYLYTREEVIQYLQESRGLVALSEIELRYRPNVLFLSKNLQSGLVALLESNQRWKSFYESSDLAVYVLR